MDEVRKLPPLAADGTPLGTIASEPSGTGDNVVFAPAEFDESTGFVKRIERIMGHDAVIDPKGEDPDGVPDNVVDALLPGFRDSAKREKALTIYITGEKSLHAIAEEVGVPDRTIAKWAEVGNWIKFQEDIAATMRRHEKVRLSVIRSRNREQTMTEQIELGHKINEAAKRHVDEAETSSQLKLAAEAAKLGSDMTNRALGIGESGKVDEADKKDEQAPTAVSLVQVFKTGGVPVVESREVIDVQPTAK